MTDDQPPCGWTVEPVCSAEEWAGYDASVQSAATNFATMVMWAATGRRFGLCRTTVRPCRRACETCPSGWFWSYGQWLPYIANGIWRNCWCGTGAGCGSCNASCQAWLPGPVNGIIEVTLNGDVVDPSTYRLDITDGAFWLVRNRTDDDDTNCWPDSQNMDRPVGLDDTWSVTYEKGLPIPAAVTDAAGVLAVEWARGCVGAACRLPGRVANLTRQGINVTMVPVDQLLVRNLTGIMEVDQVILAVNPHGLKGRPRLASVEVLNQVRYPT